MITKNTLTIPLTLLLVTILAASSISLVYAEQSALPPQVIVITNRLNLIPDGNEFDLPVDQPCYVAHGFAIGNWKTYQQKGKWLSDSVFTLEYGVGKNPGSWIPVELKNWKTHVKSYTTPAGTVLEDVMLIWFYVIFDANSFNPTTYTFNGFWDELGVTWDSSVIVTFVAS